MSGSAKSRATGRRLEALLGPVAALLLGAASAFFCFAMPAAIIARLIAIFGLPPAVTDIRLLLAGGFGIVVALATWLIFVGLDRLGQSTVRSVDAEKGEAFEELAPILRRADAHPDAPPRRPIFAGTDLGTPLDLIDPLPAEWPELGRQSSIDSAEYEPLDFLANGATRSGNMPAPRPPVAERIVTAVDALVPADPPPVRAPEAIATPAERVAEPVVSVPPPLSIDPAAPAPTLAALMGRLEAGLARKALALTGDEVNVTPLRREIRPIGGSLRAAVDELQQRTAARR